MILGKKRLAVRWFSICLIVLATVALAYLAISNGQAIQYLSLIHIFQLLTSGGPNHSTDTIMYYIYYTAFKLYRYGYGNAMGVILALSLIHI